MVVVGFFYTPFLIRHLGEEQYGLWAMVAGFVGLLAIVNLGIAPAISRQIASLKEVGEREAVNRLISTAMALFLVLFVFAVVIVLLASAFFSSFFDKIDPQYHRIARLLVLVVGFVMSLSIVAKPFSGVVMGYQRFDLLNGADLLSTLLRVSVVVVLFWFGWENLWVLMLATLMAELLRQVAYVVLAFNQHRGMHISLKHFNGGDLKYLFSFTAASFPVLMSWLILEQGGKLIVGKFLELDRVTQYSQVCLLIVMIRQWSDSLMPLWVPAAGALHARREFDRLRRGRNIACRYALAITTMGVVTLVIFSRPFIARWLDWSGPNYEDVFLSLYVLSLSQVLSSWQIPSIAILRGLNRHHPLAIAYPISIALGLTLGGLLAAYSDLGIVGVAIGVAVAQVLRTVSFVPWYVSGVLEQSNVEHLRTTLLSPLLVALPTAGVGYLLMHYVAPVSWPALFATMGATAATYAMLAYFFVLEQAERDRLKALLTRRHDRA